VLEKNSGCGTFIFVVVVGAFILFGFILNDTPSKKASSMTDKGDSSLSIEVPDKETKIIEVKNNKKDKYITRLKRELDSLSKYKVDIYLGEKDSIILGVALFSAWAMVAEEGENFTLSNEESVLLKRFKSKVASVQSKALPRLRDAYGPAVRAALWEHDMSAKTFGTGFHTIEFVGGAFASNRNIKEFQSNIYDMLHLMRFKQARYKWYKQADEYTYYNINSHKDTELIIWLENGRYREVK